MRVTSKAHFIRAFKDIGLLEGSSVLVHVSMRKFGYIVNGANDIINAVVEVVGKSGTLLASANTPQYTEPKDWENPKIPDKYVSFVKNNMDLFDVNLSMPRGRGKLAEILLMYKKTFRSNHPVRSLSALGKKAEYYTKEHNFHDPEGVNSPLHKLYQDNGYTLLIGVDMSVSSILHVAENIADVPYLYTTKCVALDEFGEFKRIKKYSQALKFNRIRGHLIKNNMMKCTKVNGGDVCIFNVKDVVDEAVCFLKKTPYYFC